LHWLFFKQRKGGLIIRKVDRKTRGLLQDVEFKITTASGKFTSTNEGLTSSNGIYITDLNGEIVLNKLQPGAYIVTKEKQSTINIVVCALRSFFSRSAFTSLRKTLSRALIPFSSGFDHILMIARILPFRKIMRNSPPCASFFRQIQNGAKYVVQVVSSGMYDPFDFGQFSRISSNCSRLTSPR